MAKYNGQLLQATIQPTFKSAGALYTIVGSVVRRLSIYELDCGQSTINTGTDCQVLWDITRMTTTSLLTGTAFLPNNLDGSDITVAQATFIQNLQSESTPVPAAGSGLSLLSPPINQRGTFRWRALDDGDNFIIPATTQAGVVVRVLSPNLTGTGNTALGSVFWTE